MRLASSFLLKTYVVGAILGFKFNFFLIQTSEQGRLDTEENLK